MLTHVEIADTRPFYELVRIALDVINFALRRLTMTYFYMEYEIDRNCSLYTPCVAFRGVAWTK